MAAVSGSAAGDGVSRDFMAAMAVGAAEDGSGVRGVRTDGNELHMRELRPPVGVFNAGAPRILPPSLYPPPLFLSPSTPRPYPAIPPPSTPIGSIPAALPIFTSPPPILLVLPLPPNLPTSPAFLPPHKISTSSPSAYPWPYPSVSKSPPSLLLLPFPFQRKLERASRFLPSAAVF